MKRFLPEAHSRQFARKSAAFAQALELLLHHRVLLEQLVHFLHGRARAASDALATTAVDRFVMIAFVWRHRIDDGLYTVQLFVVNFVGHSLHSCKRTNARQHLHNALSRTELLALAYLHA